jgi:hypothetical protein
MYMTSAPTYFGLSQPSSGRYELGLAKVLSICIQLKCIIYRISSVYIELTGVERFKVRKINEFEFRKVFQISKGATSR